MMPRPQDARPDPLLPPAPPADGFWQDRTSLAAPRAVPGCGRGLFAIAPIAAGTVIDRACTVEVAAAQCPDLDRMQPLGDFYFEHPEDSRAGLMALGLMSLCNHADSANADVRFTREDGLGWMAELVALAPIAAGSEITYRYKCPLWFPETDR